FPAVLGKARHFCWRRRWQIKRIVEKQVDRGPRRHLPRPYFVTVRRDESRGGIIPTSGLFGFPYEQPLGIGLSSGQTGVIILVLTDPVHDHTGIQALHPSVCRTIIEDTKVSPIPWQRTG